MINFCDKRILVVGDVMVDEYIWGTVSRISPEAPVPIVLANRESFIPGGAANVAVNIASLKARVTLAGVYGNDNAGRILMRKLKANRIDTGGMVLDKKRPTSLKTRIVAHNQQVVRVDRENAELVDGKIIGRILSYTKKFINQIDAIIISDYAKGVVQPKLINGLIQIARSRKKLITVDPKKEFLQLYKNVNLITPNRAEAYRLADFSEKEKLENVGKAILRNLNCENLLVTLGEQGMALFRKGVKTELIKTSAKQVYDVTGAGDTVIAVMTLALSCSVDPFLAAKLANIAAGIVVGEIGTSAIKYEQLKDSISAS